MDVFCQLRLMKYMPVMTFSKNAKRFVSVKCPMSGGIKRVKFSQKQITHDSATILLQ